MLDRCREAVAALDARIAEVLREAGADLDDRGRALLAAEQAAWTAWAQARVALAADRYRDGTHSGVAAGYAAAAVRVARIRQLLADRVARAGP